MPRSRNQPAHNMVADFLGYVPIAMEKVPLDQRADVERRIMEMDSTGQGPAKPYLRPDGVITVMSAPVTSRNLRGR